MSKFLGMKDENVPRASDIPPELVIWLEDKYCKSKMSIHHPPELLDEIVIWGEDQLIDDFHIAKVSWLVKPIDYFAKHDWLPKHESRYGIRFSTPRDFIIFKMFWVDCE